MNIFLFEIILTITVTNDNYVTNDVRNRFLRRGEKIRMFFLSLLIYM